MASSFPEKEPAASAPGIEDGAEKQARPAALGHEASQPPSTNNGNETIATVSEEGGKEQQAQNTGGMGNYFVSGLLTWQSSHCYIAE